ncbi:MAG: glycosyltransferase family 9 protein, partial [Candidatus Omnitrophota bacterium]
MDAAGSVLFFRRRCPSSTIPAPKSFLVTRIDHLGDVLLSLPVAAELKKRYPQCRVVFLVSSAALALLKNNPDIDEVVLYDAPWFVRQRGSKNRSFFGLAQKLRAMRFDAALSLRGDLRENLLVFMAGIGLRIGYGITGGGFLLNREIAYDTMVPESKRIGALLKTLDIDPGPWRPKLYFDEAEKSEFESLWRAWGAQTSKKQVGLQMDAVVASRQWPAVYLKSFCDEFARRFSDARLVLIGSKALAHVPAGAVDLTGKTTIRQLCLLLGRLDSFVGLDSGPSHLAAALEVPTLCLY